MPLKKAIVSATLLTSIFTIASCNNDPQKREQAFTIKCEDGYTNTFTETTYGTIISAARTPRAPLAKVDATGNYRITFWDSNGDKQIKSINNCKVTKVKKPTPTQ